MPRPPDPFAGKLASHRSAIAIFAWSIWGCGPCANDSFSPTPNAINFDHDPPTDEKANKRRIGDDSKNH